MPLLTLLMLAHGLLTLSSQPEAKVKQYRVTLRVVRPVLKKVPSVEEVKTNIAYSNLTNAEFHPKSPNSDKEILQKLNKSCPFFKFDRVINKTTFTLSSDTLWQAPKGFSLHDFKIALIQNNPKLLDEESNAASPSNAPTPPGLVPLPKGVQPPISPRFSAPVLKKIADEGRVVLYLNATLNSIENGKMRTYLKLAGPHIIEINATTAIIYNFNNFARERNGKPAYVMINPTDAILLSLAEVKP